MNATLAGRLTSPEARISLFYFWFYTSNGAAAAYLPIWLIHEGLTEDQIGYVNAVPILILMAVTLFVGRLADRASDWRQVIVAAAVLSGVAPLGLFLVNGFWGILALYALTMVPMMAAGPVSDAAAIRMTRRRGSEFAFVRAWGTLGFMAFNAIAGVLAAIFGPAAFLPIFAGTGLARAAAALQLPRFRADRDETPEPVETVPSAEGLAAGLVPALPARLFDALRPWFLWAVVGAAMIFSCHMLLQGFAALVWKNAGISEAVIGPLIAVGALSEALMMFAFRRFASRFAARYLILAAGLTMAVRMAVMAFNPPVPVLFGLQMLHAVTFALGFLGTVNFIANWTSEDIAAEAQSFYIVVQMGLSAAGLIVFGYLVGTLGAGAFLGGSALALTGSALVVLSLRLRPTRTEAGEAEKLTSK